MTVGRRRQIYIRDRETCHQHQRNNGEYKCQYVTFIFFLRRRTRVDAWFYTFLHFQIDMFESLEK